MNQNSEDLALNVVATLAGKVIDIRVLELQAQAELHRGLREMHRLGVSVDALSSSTGLSVGEIRKVLARDEQLADSDLLALSGVC